MNKHMWRKLVPVILVFLAIAAAAMATAGAEGKRLTPRIRRSREYTHLRGGPAVSGAEEGVTCVSYTFTVDPGNSGAVLFDYFMAIVEDPRENAPLDTMYHTGIVSDSQFSYTFYQDGEYWLFVDLYDSNGKPVYVNGESCITHVINIENGTGANPLTAAVEAAAAQCNRNDEFLTAVAINDYLAELVTYDHSYTYYSPEGALLGAHTCVCNGYSWAYRMIANACGLACRRVVGTGGGNDHAWNAVRINGRWYQVDPTWNDTDDTIVLRHVFMGLSDAVMGINHSDFEYPDGNAPASCNTLDDNYFVRTGKWTDLAGNAAADLQAELDGTSGPTAVITADFGTTAWLEIPEGTSGHYHTAKTDILQINGHIVAWAMSLETWTRNSQGAETAMRGTFTYSYGNGASTLTGELAQAWIDYGTCGEGLAWVLDTDGVLTVGGEGDMYDFSSAASQPWAENRSLITEVIITEGVTGIGKNAFYQCTAMTDVTFPETTLARIGSTAFYLCRSLESVSVPDSVSSMGTLVFSDCLSLAEARLPSGISAIPMQAFYGCTGLTSVFIPEGINTIGDNAFLGCSALETVYIPLSVGSVQFGAFQFCNSLADVYYAGTKSQWDAITIYSADSNAALTGAALHTHYGTEHAWSEVSYAWEEDCGHVTATRTCALDDYCTETETAETVSEQTKDATCTENGETTYSATFTNPAFGTASKTVDNIPAEGHELTPHAAAEATCTEPGNHAYWSCGKCGGYFTDETGTTGMDEGAWVIGELGHDQVHYDAKEPTCTEAGWDAYDVCTRCGYSTYREVPALDHLWGEAEYTWADGNGSVTAARICERDAGHTETETAATACTVTLSPTDDETGAAVYRAEFENEAFSPREKILEIPALKDMNVLRLPAQLAEIETGAFAGAACDAVIIPEGCGRIGSGAFADCPNLIYIWIPAGTAEIAEDAFEGCEGLIRDVREGD